MGRDSPRSSSFLCLFHLSSFKNHLVFYLLIFSGSLYSFYFKFNHSMTNREVVDVFSLSLSLSLLLGEVNFRRGRRDLHV